MGSGIQAIGKTNELLSAMTVCRHGLHNGVMAYMLQTRKSTMNINFWGGEQFL